MAIALLGLLAPRADTAFALWIAAGLFLALIGDIRNVDMTDEKTVITGLVIFVFAYLVYSVGLTVINGFQKEDIPCGLAVLLLYVSFMVYIRKGLGDMKVPVLLYGLNSSFMVSRAVSTCFGTAFSLPAALLLTAGTLMVFLGDMEFAIHKFRRPLSHEFGPILYAGGQLLIGLGPAYFGW